MKKKILLVTMVTMLGLSGCTSAGNPRKPEGAAAVEKTLVVAESEEESCTAEERKALCLEQASYGDILDPEWEGKPLAPATIMDDYLSGRQEYVDQYYTIGENGWIWAMAYLGDNHIDTRCYYPKATCANDWTAEDLVEGYIEQTLPWTQRDNCYNYLYSSDYRNRFEIYDDWLVVDNIKVCPVGYETLGVEPMEVLYKYQHGWWDGTIPIFSCDGGTVASIDSCDGVLDYRYETISYSEEYDPMQLSQTPYLDLPSFMATGVDDNFVVSYLDSYDYEREGECSGKIIRAEVEVYVDLPNGTSEGFEDLLVLHYVNPEVGMYVVMSDRVELYRRGVLMESWDCEVSTIHPRLIYYGEGDVFEGEVHLQSSDEKIVRLLPNGEVEIVLNGLTGDVYGIGEYSLMNLSLKGGKLMGYSQRWGVVDIADNIASVDYAWNIMLMTGEDGLCYAFETNDFIAMERQVEKDAENGKAIEPSLTVHCLGEESWERYLGLYQAGLLELSNGDEL